MQHGNLQLLLESLDAGREGGGVREIGIHCSGKEKAPFCCKDSEVVVSGADLSGLGRRDMVLAAGLDLFFVRTTPSQSFDQLASDYNHPLLILLMVALVSATFATWQLSSAQTLKANWK